EQAVFLEAPDARGSGAGRKYGGARRLGAVEPQLDLALERRRHAALLNRCDRQITTRSYGCSPVRLKSLRTNHVKRRDRGGRREEMPKDFSACSASSAFNVAFFHGLSEHVPDAQLSLTRESAAAIQIRQHEESRRDSGVSVRTAARCR